MTILVENESRLLQPILMLDVSCQPLAAVVIITAEKEEMRRRSRKSEHREKVVCVVRSRVYPCPGGTRPALRYEGLDP